jgi:prolyl 4-hydroxylase
LSEAESQAVIRLWREESASEIAVVGPQGYGRVLRRTATSKGMLLLNPSPVLEEIGERIEMLTGVPQSHHEPFYLIRYMPGEYFAAHLDAHPQPGRATSKRVATMVIYLNSVDSGGETLFPLAAPLVEQHWTGIPSSCAGFEKKNSQRQGPWEVDQYLDGSDRDPNGTYEGKGIAIEPLQGTGVLFYNLHRNGSIDWASRHAGCPVVSGNKWILSKWMYLDPVPQIGSYSLPQSSFKSWLQGLFR